MTRRSLARKEDRPSGGNACGDCHACCTWLGVEALGKEPGKVCGLLNDRGGCTFYEHRPDECKSFECLWLDGTIRPIEARPDRVGWFAYWDGDILVMQKTLDSCDEAFFAQLVQGAREAGIYVHTIDVKGTVEIFEPIATAPSPAAEVPDDAE